MPLQIRGLLLDRGFAFAKSITRARRMIPDLLADQDNELTAMARAAIAELYDLFRDLDRRIASFDKKIDEVFRKNEACQRIAKIKGVGPKTATAVIAAIGDGSEFKNGRHLAAWVGLVPRQFSSGDRKILKGISKRGSLHLRSLLVHHRPLLSPLRCRRSGPDQEPGCRKPVRASWRAVDRIRIRDGEHAVSAAAQPCRRFVARNAATACLSNNAAERELRGIALGRKSWLFAGSDRGGERAAVMLTLIQTARLNDIDPQAWLADVLARIADHKITDLAALLPWNWRRAIPVARAA